MTPFTAPSASRATSHPRVVSVLYLKGMTSTPSGDFRPFSETDYPTPHVENLARAGCRFNNFYVPQAVCSASRATLLTQKQKTGACMFLSSPSAFCDPIKPLWVEVRCHTHQAMASWSVSIRSSGTASVQSLSKQLRIGKPAVVGRIQQDQLLLCLHGVFPGQDDALAASIIAAAQNLNV